MVDSGPMAVQGAVGYGACSGVYALPGFFSKQCLVSCARAGHVSRQMLGPLPGHIRMEAKRRTLEGIVGKPPALQASAKPEEQCDRQSIQ